MDKLIKIIEELNETGAIGYSAYIELITEVRYQQILLQQQAG